MWRTLALWKHGGVYIDAKFGINAPMEKWIDWDNSQYLVCNCRRFTPTTNSSNDKISSIGLNGCQRDGRKY